MHLRCLGVRAQEQEGEVIRAEGGQQQRSRALEECLLAWQVVNVLHNRKKNSAFSHHQYIKRQQTPPAPHAEAKPTCPGKLLVVDRHVLQHSEARPLDIEKC